MRINTPTIEESKKDRTSNGVGTILKGLLGVPRNTNIVCSNCGFDYEIQYTEIFNILKSTRICYDCIGSEL